MSVDPQTPVTDLNALQAAISLVADAANDTINALAPGQSAIQKIMDYKNLVEDIIMLVPQIGHLPDEVSSLSADDYILLTGQLVTKLAITDTHAQKVVAASLKLLSGFVKTTLPDIKDLATAIKGEPAPAPSA